jgi:hypothetical protein
MPPVKIAMIGLMRSPTSDVTIAVKAAPMMMPTAMSMTLPRAMKSLNSLIIVGSTHCHCQATDLRIRTHDLPPEHMTQPFKTFKVA